MSTLQPCIDFPCSTAARHLQCCPCESSATKSLMDAPSPWRDPFFVKFGYAAMTSDLDRKRQVPHRQDHTDTRTTTDRNAKFLSERE
ncbi:hypothetical protein TRIUR3_27760 [Triticum urartu]|uniref:Uncharacterized protein n=1 Tax=Triticum urartu TaxID=4572 RepID=M7YJZ9_TRIUA|nr:hypothetical protein TRIUR3_27760 [Triticum urartu]